MWRAIIREAVRLELGAARPRFITAADVAAMLSVSPRHVAALVARGELPARYVGGALRFSVDAVEAFMRALPRSSSRTRKTPPQRKGAERAA